MSQDLRKALIEAQAEIEDLRGIIKGNYHDNKVRNTLIAGSFFLGAVAGIFASIFLVAFGVVPK